MRQKYFFSINVSGIEIPCVVKQKPMYRRCSIRVSGKGASVTVPAHYPEYRWRDFINQHRVWIFHSFEKHRKLTDSLPVLEPGAAIPFKGRFYEMRVMSGAELAFSEGYFTVPSDIEAAGTETLKSTLAALYINEAAELLVRLTDKWKHRLSGAISTVLLKEMKTRWGSCSSSGAIALNWRLIMADPDIFEYVFVHEICHIDVKSHNRVFWELVTDLIPDAKRYRKILKDNNYLYMNFPFSPGSSRTFFKFSLESCGV